MHLASAPALDSLSAQARGSYLKTVVGGLVTIMAFPTSHFWAQPSMCAIKIITHVQTSTQASDNKSDESHAGPDQSSLDTLEIIIFKGLSTPSSCQRPSYLCPGFCSLSRCRLYTDSSMCSALGSSPIDCCPPLSCLMVCVYR